MKKIKLNVVCTDVDNSEGGVYIASFVPAEEKNPNEKLKDGFRLQACIEPLEELEEGAEPEEKEAEGIFQVGEIYEVVISEPRKELSEEEKAKQAEAKAKKAEADKAYKAKKKAEADEAKKKAFADGKAFEEGTPPATTPTPEEIQKNTEVKV
jgi:colicin import membrane protein